MSSSKNIELSTSVLFAFSTEKVVSVQLTLRDFEAITSLDGSSQRYLSTLMTVGGKPNPSGKQNPLSLSSMLIANDLVMVE